MYGPLTALIIAVPVGTPFARLWKCFPSPRILLLCPYSLLINKIDMTRLLFEIH